MQYKYYICDVFTTERFGGNQLAVLPEADGLTSEQMQKIAREFNFSESTFVSPALRGNTRKVRIFTPLREMPFAGHPNIGTAFVLAAGGELEGFGSDGNIVFEEEAGLVPISLHSNSDKELFCELEAPETLTLGAEVSNADIAAALSLEESDIVIDTHRPQQASVGASFLFVELSDLSALQRIKVNIDGLELIASQGVAPHIHAYVRSAEGSTDKVDIRARMFAPLDGIVEDPATGSANCALAALLTHYNESPSGQFSWQIVQGVEMGRPSQLTARSTKIDGKVDTVFIGGYSVMVSEGVIYCD